MSKRFPVDVILQHNTDGTILPLCKKCNKQKGSRIVAAEEYYPFLKSEYCFEADKYKNEEGISS